MLTTHYTSICKRVQKSSALDNRRPVRNMKMDAHVNANGELTYTYRMVPGISRIEGAYSVLQELNYPKEILTDFKST